MTRLPSPPPEVPRETRIELLAPVFRIKVENVLADMRERGHAVRVFETFRTEERQAYLYGFGRKYDDGRGPVTKAASALSGWHAYGLAADLVQDDASPWVAPQAFWQDLGRIAELHGCTWGGRWKMVDLPHIQWGKCRRSPSDESRRLIRTEGVAAVWRAVGAA